jgi:hypothetical protein
LTHAAFRGCHLLGGIDGRPAAAKPGRAYRA